MDYFSIIAFAIGVIIVAAIAYIKNQNLIKADAVASHIVKIVKIAIKTYAPSIKEYDKENSTDFFGALTKAADTLDELVSNDSYTPLQYALKVKEIYGDIQDILVQTGIKDDLEKSAGCKV